MRGGPNESILLLKFSRSTDNYCTYNNTYCCKGFDKASSAAAAGVLVGGGAV